MYGDNRDLKPSDLRKKEKYHLHVETTVAAFCFWFSFPKTVLDIGTRDGYAVELLTGRGYQALGVDLIPDYVKYAQERGRRVIQGDALDLPIEDNAYDFVFSRHCIEHTPDPQKFMLEVSRVLKCGGSVFMTFPMETTKEWKARDRNDHLCHFPDKGDFLSTVPADILVEYAGKSKRFDIKPDGRELLFVGLKNG